MDVVPVGVYVIHAGSEGLRVYEKEDTATEQGASTRMVEGIEGVGYEKVFSGKVINSLRGVREGVKDVDD